MLKYTHGKLYLPNQKNLLELPFILAEKFSVWKEQYQHDNVVYSWVWSKIICMRSGTQTFLFLQRFSWRILYFYISAAPRATGWMVFICKAVAARRLDLKRRRNKVAFHYSRVTNIPNPKPLTLFNLLMMMDFRTMYPKVLLQLRQGRQKCLGRWRENLPIWLNTKENSSWFHFSLYEDLLLGQEFS